MSERSKPTHTERGFVPVSWAFTLIAHAARTVMWWAEGRHYAYTTIKPWRRCVTPECTTVGFDPDMSPARGRCGSCGKRGRPYVGRELRRRVFR